MTYCWTPFSIIGWKVQLKVLSSENEGSIKVASTGLPLINRTRSNTFFFYSRASIQFTMICIEKSFLESQYTRTVWFIFPHNCSIMLVVTESSHSVAP